MRVGEESTEGLIAIVDDEESVRRLLDHKVATSWGYRAALFPDGESLLHSPLGIFDTVLLDIMLPGVDGIETLQRLRAADSELPVIMLSAQAQIDGAIEAIRLGAADYFTKPIDLLRLEVVLRNSVRMRSLARELRRVRESALSPSSPGDAAILPFELIKQDAIRNALRVTRGNALEASRRLHIGRATLYRLAKKYQIRI